MTISRLEFLFLTSPFSEKNWLIVCEDSNDNYYYTKCDEKFIRNLF